MRFLVLGCNGMAGHLISLYLKERGHDVFGFAREKSKFIPTILGDAFNQSLVSDTIIEGNYDSVINCIGVLNQFADMNKPQAVYLNSFFPHFLAQITNNMSTQIIHLSTDCVFSGKKGKYSETDVKDGSSFYDRTKALGELDDQKNLTLRQSIVGPDIKPKGIGLLNWFLQQKDEIDGYTKAIWTGQTTLQLAKTIECAAKEKAHGLINMVPDFAISKYDLLKLANKYLKTKPIQINPVPGVDLDKSLIRTNFDFKYQIPNYEIMMIELQDWIISHKDLYKHYF